MATWKEASWDSYRAAQKLYTAGHYRSSISRSYYAAYSTLAFDLPKEILPQDRDGPGHEQLQHLIRRTLPLSKDQRRHLGRALRPLYELRLIADYRPSHDIDKKLAMECLRNAGIICVAKGVIAL